jgi:hypothetical protein
MVEAKPENLIGDRAYDSDPPYRRSIFIADVYPSLSPNIRTFKDGD